MAFIKINGIQVHFEIFNAQGYETIIALHGFTGSSKTWQHVAKFLPNARIIAIDLIGHGQTDAPADVEYYTMDAQVELLHAIIKQLVGDQKYHLLGYSMGGRVALSYATKYPEMLKSLLLESASPGLSDQQARLERKQSDAKLATKIMNEPLEVFVAFWENIPLFASQKCLPQSIQEEVKKERLSQQPLGLANSLLGMGTGDMPSLWHHLESLKVPVFLVTGSLDTKFIMLAEKMKQFNKTFKHVTISGVGHAIHVENPQKFATIVKESILIQ